MYENRVLRKNRHQTLYLIENLKKCKDTNDYLNFIFLINSFLKEIDNEFNLINKLQEEKYFYSQSRQKLQRIKYAIYRLYRTYDLPLEEISMRTNININIIRNYIGEIFTKLCIKDDKCIFKKYLIEL